MSRELTAGEKEIIRICNEKYGADPRDKVSFFPTGEAVMLVWGDNGDGPFVHLTNIASMLDDGVLSREEIRETQV